MLKRIIHIAVIGLVFTAAFLSFSGTLAHAAPIDPKSQACEALVQASTGNSGNCDTAVPGPNVDNTLKLAINVFSFIVGVAAIIMIIVGGLKYVISQGEGSNTASAKNTILYAIIGLVVVVLAQVIVKFVLAKSTTLPACSATITTNCTP